MIKSVVLYFEWSPNIIAEMYCDDIDFQGIQYWFEEVKKIDKKLKS
jgi:hypothetical protein